MTVKTRSFRPSAWTRETRPGVTCASGTLMDHGVEGAGETAEEARGAAEEDADGEAAAAQRTELGPAEGGDEEIGGDQARLAM